MKKESKGLGDSVEKVLKATGIDKIAKFVLGEDCGCEERKKKLNKAFPYRKPNCLVEEEYLWLKEYYKENKNTISPIEQKELLLIKGRVFNQKLEPSTCASCIATHIEELRVVFDAYKDAK